MSIANNLVILTGRLGKDPETREVGDTQVSNFSIATEFSYKDKKGEWIKGADWHNIVAWRNLSVYVDRYMKKGSLVTITGSLKTRSWEDKEGVTKYITEIVASEIKGRDKVDNNSNNESASKPKEETPKKNTSMSLDAEDDDDDLPF